MIKQIRYFQAVVHYKNFTEAAEECYISQSAISQQIQALERDLGVKLLHREKRKFSLTPAGEYFYRKSLMLIDDFERICQETVRIEHGGEKKLRVSYLKHYAGRELQLAIADFTAKYSSIGIQITNGTHEELYDFLRMGQSDIVINDQRRALSDAYVNYKLTTSYVYVEIATRNAIAELPSVTTDELKNMPCILISSREQQANEQEYHRNVIGFSSDFIFADSLEEARLMVVSNKGFMPVEFTAKPEQNGTTVRYVPLLRDDRQIKRDYYAFWRVGNDENHIEEFAALLKEKFLQADAGDREQ
ncbi:HTH-type transcriptional regulator HdfR [Sporomusa silvacetica DSM 10669]|uniref:HTH-type transcriptional regulator HdfR n=1 Tax=Sporomusa silvacetica DSM 10669 TaxID=1123289 RepID=A0ABZ3IFQ2_9FIRM|nr:LysR family transcriptional regulator [Sporomusa silvacetica]OZC17107.1 HTH-type transcriptional regulator BenM [Sporomusa silvacetica DSM 10669]